MVYIAHTKNVVIIFTVVKTKYQLHIYYSIY